MFCRIRFILLVVITINLFNLKSYAQNGEWINYTNGDYIYKWLGGYGGLSVYNENGIVKVDNINSDFRPENYILYQNYPNPFNPTTNISFYLGGVSFVKLKIYNILGQEIATLVNDYELPGVHKFIFKAGNLSSGVYFYKLQAGGVTEIKKMILLR